MRLSQVGSRDKNGIVHRIGGLSIVGLLLLVGLSSAATVRTTSRLNLRQEPTTSSPRIVLLPVGAELEVLSRRGLWIRVVADGKEGWVHSDYVVDSALDAVAGDPSGRLRRTARDAALARDVALLRVGKLEREIEVLRASAPDATKQNAELRERVAELSSLLEEREALVATLAEEIAAVGDVRALPTVEAAPPESGLPDRHVEENARLSKRVSELEGELTSARVAITGHGDSLRALEDRLASATAAGAALEERALALESVTEERDAQAVRLVRVEAYLAERGDDLVSARTRAQAAAEEAVVERVRLEARLTTVEEERDLLARSASTREHRISELEETLSERETTLESLQGALEENRDSTLQTAARERDLAADRDRLAAEVTAQEAGLKTVAEQAKERDERVAALETVAAEKDEKLRAAQEALAVGRGERDRLARMAADHETDGRGYAEALLELQEWSDQAEDEIARLGTLNAELKATVGNLRGKASRRQEPLRSELEAANARAQDAAERLADAERETSRLRAELAASSAASDASDSRLGVALGERTEADEARKRSEAEAARRELAAAKEQLSALRADRAPLRVPMVAPAEPIVDPARQASAVARAADARDPRVDAIAAVRRWARAWSSRDVEGYLASYGGSFQPTGGLGRGEWVEQRRIRLGRASFIEVEVSELEIRLLSPDRLAVRFRQDYRSDRLADRVLKTLELARIEGDWKIVREVAE